MPGMLAIPNPAANYMYETVPQKGLNGRAGYQPRGKGLGGSSAINAMIYIRGNKWDYDNWAALGCTGWGFDDVLPYFKRAEHNVRGEDAYHGDDGPLWVSDQKWANPGSHAFVEAAAELQLPRNADFNAGKQEGFGLYQVTQKDGERWSAARLCRTETRIEEPRRPHRRDGAETRNRGWPRHRRHLFGGQADADRQGTRRRGAVGGRLQFAPDPDAVGHRSRRASEGTRHRCGGRQARSRFGPAGPYRLCFELADQEQGFHRLQPGGQCPHGESDHRTSAQAHRHHDHPMPRPGGSGRSCPMRLHRTSNGTSCPPCWKITGAPR